MNVQHVCVHARSVLSCTMQAAVSSALLPPLFISSFFYPFRAFNDKLKKKKINKNKYEQFYGILLTGNYVPIQCYLDSIGDI